ncbi:hypothetical protein C5N14_23725 [Micromonospora sp. MW-13]|uniref:hypothetical protein n=1 Tax=Micromonospora sp. MW-13 TaxID=2094022 RepID=UPI000E432F05|nr:hypothetical protein [Micromonospora sp. MW-13]RGC66410.1 hypothetical protein C5N14_23725 [Micromonospora sp. MW-13]
MSRRYPIPRPADDPRFTFGLALDVAQVLAAHGYPAMAEPYDGCGADLVDLQQALFSLIYGIDVSEGHLS